MIPEDDIAVLKMSIPTQKVQGGIDGGEEFVKMPVVGDGAGMMILVPYRPVKIKGSDKRLIDIQVIETVGRRRIKRLVPAKQRLWPGGIYGAGKAAGGSGPGEQGVSVCDKKSFDFWIKRDAGIAVEKKVFLLFPGIMLIPYPDRVEHFAVGMVDHLVGDCAFAFIEREAELSSSVSGQLKISDLHWWDVGDLKLFVLIGAKVQFETAARAEAGLFLHISGIVYAENDLIGMEIEFNAEGVPFPEHPVAVEVKRYPGKVFAKDHLEPVMKVGSFVVDKIDVFPIVRYHSEDVAKIGFVAGQKVEVEGEFEVAIGAPGGGGEKIEGSPFVLYLGMAMKTQAIGLGRGNRRNKKGHDQ
jgi:hypothetical protein